MQKKAADMNLEQFKKNLPDLTDEELLEIIHGTRNNRNTAPARPARKKAAGKKKEKDELAALEAVLATLTPEQIAELLGGDNDEG